MPKKMSSFKKVEKPCKFCKSKEGRPIASSTKSILRKLANRFGLGTLAASHVKLITLR